MAARTPLEAGLCAIWSGLLGSKQVGIHDNFFALGGHSLLAMQVIARIRLTFQVEVPYQALFETPTIAGLAQRIAEARDETANPMPPLLPAARIQALPMSFAQQRLWFLDRYEPGNTTYNIPVALRLTGALDMDALQQSLNLLVQRHEALRTVFAVSEGEPIQIIQKFAPQDLPLTDLSSMGLVKRQEEARRLIRAEARRSFDLEHGPLFRTALLRLETEQHILLLTLHHIVSDGWSQDVLTKELTAAYNAFCSELPSPLPDLPIQYADYAAWQRNWLAGEELERLSAYWKEHLAGAPALLELPTDRPRPPLQTFEGALTRTTLPPELSQAVKQLGQREGSTLFMTLLAVFNILLARYSGQEDIVIGTPIANRTQTEVEGLIGFFVNTLAVRTQLSGDPNFIELLGRVREAALGAFAHQDLPFEKLVEELQPERSLSHSPIFQVVFALQNLPQSRWKLGALQVEEIPTAGATAKFDLSLFASESTGGLELELEYNTDLFDADRIERMLGHFQTLLQTIVANPNEKVSRLPLLTEAERQQLLVGWNQTAVDYPNFCIHQLFQQQAERTPEAIAAQFEHQQLTYRELNHRANQLAHFLHEQGIGPEQMVGLCVERSLDMLVGMLGILKAGAAYLPLDPNYPQERLAFLLEDTQAPLLITQKPLLDHFPDYEGKRFCLDTDGNTIFSFSQEAPVSNVTADNLAYLIYTSGSTGRPKGVAIAHASATRLLQWAATRYSPEELSGVLASTSLCFDLSVFEIFLPLSVGGKILLAPNALALPQMPARDQVTLINTVPSAITELLNQGAIPSSVRTVNLAGEPLSTELADRLYAAGVGKVYDLYGPSEDTTYSTFTLRHPQGVATIGRPISNTQLYLLDARMQPVPVGVSGEIYLGGEGLARGYLNRAELTSERFVADPFGKPGGRLYRTGDLGKYFRDGNVAFLGRMDHQVKIRGFRIELGEIERRLREHAQVADAIVLAREDVAGHKRLVAYVVLRAGGLGVGELRGHLGVTLPEYMIPSAFVFLEAIPLTPNGKIDRKALPAPDGARPVGEREYQAPRTSTEEALAKIWSEVLRLPKVGIHDNFFELGGDSILSIQIIARANQADLHLTPRQVFQHQTIAALAAVAGTGPQLQSEQGTASGPVPLTPIQRWFFEQDRVEAYHFNQARLLVLDRSVSAAQVERAVSALVAHHDALRLRFVRTEAGWEQNNAAEETHPVFTIRDLSGVAEAEQGEAITRACSELQASLDLGQGPLLRAAYFDLGPEQPARLLLALHHLCMDGVSWRVLLEDLGHILEQLGRGETIALPPKTTSFQHWAQRLVEYAHSEALKKEFGYWESLNGDGADLPRDVAGGSNTVGSQRAVRVALGAKETQALLQEVPVVYHTQINDVLMTALAQAFRTWTGERRLLVDLEGHGREALFEDVDVSRTVGWFTSLYPVLLELPANEDLGEALKRVKETLHSIPTHGVGYGLLRYLASDPDIKRNLDAVPQPRVSFNYHGQLDQVIQDSGVLSAARESVGLSFSPNAARSHLLEVISLVRDDCLYVTWVYSEQVHHQATVERLAEDYLAALRRLIAHCQSPEAGGYTPSDFPKARVSQQALDRLMTKINKR
ncbi:MAG TPA: amino acid adenylation domain-containing protein [Chthonomonadaceae bacterium]|nr:amino acid adenylation domain-containing protein [Chthonomonadaceae bacterium]